MKQPKLIDTRHAAIVKAELEPEAATIRGWRVGNAGTTIFGPKKPDGTLPDIIASQVGRKYRFLLSAAPELYEACRACNDAYNFISEHPHHHLLRDAVLKCRAAIAKAQGPIGARP